MASRVRLPSISLIVARSYPGNVIGYKNKLPWHIKSDLRRFRIITTGHAVIMGRATFDSIGRALSNRTNIVMSTNAILSNQDVIDVDGETQLYWANNRENALFVADISSILRDVDDIFIIGGERMYELFDELVNRVFLTEVFDDFEGDSFFKKKFRSKEWKYLVEEDHSKNYAGDDHNYRFTMLERRERRYRHQYLTQFYTEQADKIEWMKRNIPLNAKIVQSYIQNHLDL